MRRLLLADATVVADPPAEDPRPVAHRALGEPSRARPVARRHFDPADGWFRRIERETSRLLSRYVFPRVPGVTIPYGAILSRGLTASEVSVEIPGLGPGLAGTRTLFVTDLHAGPFLSARALRDALSRAAAERPDLILLGGDYASTRLAELEPHRETFRSLRAPLGVFAVLGNHDYYTEDGRRVAAYLADCGIRVLLNEAVRIERAGDALVLAGIDDLHCGKPGLDLAIEHGRRLEAEAPVVLLSHNPDVFFAAARRGVALVLSGHTHGGQVRLPGLPVLVRQSRYRLDEGRYRWNGSELVVSRGLGASGLPVRLFCPPEVVLLTLRGPGSRRGP